MPSEFEITNARSMDGMVLAPKSPLWPKVSRYQRLGLIRLRWLEDKSAQLRFVEPAAVPAGA